MLFDVVQEMQAQVETLVSSQIKLAEWSVDCLKWRLKGFNGDVKERLEKLERYVLRSVLDVAGYANTLKEWTGKTVATIIFDSKVDPFTDECLFEKVKGKSNIAVIGITTDGDVFGGFYSVAVTEQDKALFDPNVFAFSFESHGRCENPQRFNAKLKWWRETGVVFYKNHPYGHFVQFEVCGSRFFLGNESSDLYCQDMSWGFEDIEDTTLSGNNYPEKFSCCRLVAILFE